MKWFLSLASPTRINASPRTPIRLEEMSYFSVSLGVCAVNSGCAFKIASRDMKTDLLERSECCLKIGCAQRGEICSRDNVRLKGK